MIYAQNIGDQLFAESIIHEIRVQTENSTLLDDLFDIYLENYEQDQPYSQVDLLIDGTSIDSVGIRVKGGITAFDPKRPLKFDFNEIVPSKSYDGIKKVNLHNVYFDQALVREALAYNVLRTAGQPAPRTAFCKLFINDEYEGLYLLVEQVNHSFTKRFFASDEGVLYKDKACSISVKTDNGSLAPYDEYAEIMETLVLEDLQEALKNVLNVDQLIQQIVLQNVMNIADNLMMDNCNYYIYYEPKSEKLHYIPWDYNLGLYNGTNKPIVFLNNYFLGKLQQVPDYRDFIIESTCEILHYNFTEERVFALIDQWIEILEPSLIGDPYIASYLDELDESVEALKANISNRLQELDNGFMDISYDCETYDSEIQPMEIVINEFMTRNGEDANIFDPSNEAEDWIEIYNNSDKTFDLSDVFLSDDIDFPKRWRFPYSTTIGPNEYLIVWADRDIDQVDYHSVFKLNSSGGDLILSHDNGLVLDFVSYSQQEESISMSRIPNGTGEFQKTAHSFDTSNGMSTSSSTLEIATSKIIPNPTNGMVTIEGECVILSENYVIKDVNGKIRLSGKLSATNQVDISPLNEGVYFLELSNGLLFKILKI